MAFQDDAWMYALVPASATAVAVSGLIASWEYSRRKKIEQAFGEGGDVEALRSEIARVQEELNTKREQLAKLDNQQLEAQQHIGKAGMLQVQIEELEQKKRNLADIQKRVQDLDDQAREARNNRDLANTQRVESELKHHALEHDVSRLEDKENQLLVKVKGIEQQIGIAERKFEEEIKPLENTIETKNKDLQSIESNLVVKMSELEGVKADLVQLEARRAVLEVESEKMRNEINGDEAYDEDQYQRLASVWEPILPEQREITNQANEDELLESTASYLDDLGLVFPRRVLYSFHTGLKVSAEATLLILAGISGTGKSLLPQRYAEGMGINFQLIPVQPRWDGPQDLLGFYNFLQNKYVATDLIRALVQMHQFPGDWDIPEGSRFQTHKDEMLLVLLDEMNLARIEYYFSDLLSKLETRRTIKDFSDPNDRLKASFELNVGLGDTGSNKPVRVYPGMNCMFVGTMNEDESTQSVSDKVVDRANVMRFAKPRVLHSQHTSASLKPEPAKRSLRSHDWEKWQQRDPLSANDLGNLEMKIEKLNEALQLVERPFGHRVKQAICKYIEMYPDRSDQGRANAFADQIEMRILPKLRGIEIDENAKDAIDQVQGIAGKHDSELATAISDAQDRDDNRFHWMGLSRDK